MSGEEAECGVAMTERPCGWCGLKSSRHAPVGRPPIRPGRTESLGGRPPQNGDVGVSCGHRVSLVSNVMGRRNGALGIGL